MPKFFAGRDKIDSDWDLLGAVDFDGIPWKVFGAPCHPKTRWGSVKVCADGIALHKANYWLTWNGRGFSSTRDLVTMAERRPQLVSLVRDLLEEKRPRQT